MIAPANLAPTTTGRSTVGIARGCGRSPMFVGEGRDADRHGCLVARRRGPLQRAWGSDRAIRGGDRLRIGRAVPSDFGRPEPVHLQRAVHSRLPSGLRPTFSSRADRWRRWSGRLRRRESRSRRSRQASVWWMRRAVGSTYSICAAGATPQGGVQGRDNANSIVLGLQYGGRRILLPGDLESPGLDTLVSEASGRRQRKSKVEDRRNALSSNGSMDGRTF